MTIQITHHALPIILRDRHEHIAKHNTETVDGTHLRHPHHKGTATAQELRMGQQLLYLSHTHQRVDCLATLQMEAEIILHTLDIQDIVEKDTVQFIVTLDEYDTVAEKRILLRLGTKPSERLFSGTEEILIRYRFQQVIYRIDLKTLNGILRESRCEDNTRYR